MHEKKSRDRTHGGEIYGRREALDFSTSVNPMGTPERIIAAAAESLSRINCYPDVQCRKLRERISQAEGVPAESIICGNGAAELIFVLSQAAKPRSALIQAPTFGEYEQALTASGCKIRYYESKESTGFGVEEDVLERMDDIDFMVLCNPNNPTGRLIERGVLEAVCQKSAERGIRLLIDECFLDFVVRGDSHSLKKLTKKSENIFVLKAFTKKYAMAGLRLGYGICSDTNLIEAMEAARQPWSVSVPAQAAGLAALEDDSSFEGVLEMICREREYIICRLREMAAEGKSIKVFNSEANYIFFKAREDLGAELCERGILIRDCGNYVGLSKGFYRIGVRLHEENEKLMKLLEQLL